jgi:hypothetical protein
MSYFKIILILFLFISKAESQMKFDWNLKRKIERARNREDTTKWDKTLLNMDITDEDNKNGFSLRQVTI